MKSYNVLVLTVFLIVFMAVPECMADWRSYVWTYEYQTVDRGDAELESYFTLSTPEIDRMEGITTTDFQLELEVGMTERYDFSIYQIFEQAPEGSLRYKGYKLRSRYRFGEKGRYPLDPLIYVEYKGKPDFSEHGIELKLILAKDIGATNIALNPILEFERDGEWEVEPEYAVGITRRISDLLKFGLEAKGGESGHYIGPVISHGRDDLWVSLGSAIKLGDVDEGKPEFQIRLLMAVGFFE